MDQPVYYICDRRWCILSTFTYFTRNNHKIWLCYVYVSCTYDQKQFNFIGIIAILGPQHRQLRHSGRGEDNPHRRAVLRAVAERHRQRRPHVEKLLQVAEISESWKRHASPPPRRGHSNNAEGHLRQTKCTMQHAGRCSCRRHVQLGEELQR